MKNDAIVSNIINRNSAIIKICNTSYVVNYEMEDLKEIYSKGSSPIKTLSINSDGAAGSQPIKTSYELFHSINKVEPNEVNVYCPQTGVALNNAMIRYIRDWSNGSNKNAGSHWIELQVIHKDGTNLAYGKQPTSNGSLSNGSYITDGSTNTNNYASITSGNDRYIEIDLGQEYSAKDIKEIKIWHYYADGRTYYNTKTEMSLDKNEWIVLRDSAVKGTYPETSEGITLPISVIQDHEYPSFVYSDITTMQPTKHHSVETLSINCNEATVIGIGEKSVLNKNLKPIQLKAINIDEGIKSENIFITSKDKTSNNYNVLDNFRYASTIVKTKIPVDTGGSNGTAGEGLKSLDLELIPFNYVKIKLGFTDKKVVDTIGLPPGLKIRDGYIDGSPTISGDYNMKILLDDNTVIPGKIKVHVLDRIL